MMKNVNIKLSDKLYNELLGLCESLTIKEKNIVTFDDIVEESLMEHFNIKISNINKYVNYDVVDATIVDSINNKNNKKDYYIYVYYNNRNSVDLNVGDYHFSSEPLYIGKGCGDRMYSMNNRGSNLVQLINELKSTNEFSMSKLIVDLDDITAHNYEQLLISSIGRLNNGTGPLYNISGGFDKKIQKLLKSNSDLNIEYRLIQLILKALNNSDTISDASKKLNISERTLYRKIDKYSIKKNINNGWVIDEI